MERMAESCAESVLPLMTDLEPTKIYSNLLEPMAHGVALDQWSAEWRSNDGQSSSSQWRGNSSQWLSDPMAANGAREAAAASYYYWGFRRAPPQFPMISLDAFQSGRYDGDELTRARFSRRRKTASVNTIL